MTDKQKSSGATGDGGSPSDDRPRAPDRHDDFPARIVRLAELCGGVMELARRSALSHQVIRKYIRGVSDPSRERLVALAGAGPVHLEWLATGRGPMLLSSTERDGGAGEGAPGPLQRMVAIPLIDPGTQPDADSTSPTYGDQGFLYIDRESLAAFFWPTAADLAVFVMHGDSMAPTIRAESPVIIDRSAAGREPVDGVFVCRLDGRPMVKRLQWLPGRRLRVHSDNPAYKSYELDKPKSPLFVIYGRVLFSLHRP